MCAYDPMLKGFGLRPMHCNESGSRTRRTLGRQGSRDVALKAYVGQTRDQRSLNTCASSEKRRLVEYPPLEALCKGGHGAQTDCRNRLGKVSLDSCALPLTFYIATACVAVLASGPLA